MWHAKHHHCSLAFAMLWAPPSNHAESKVPTLTDPKQQTPKRLWRSLLIEICATASIHCLHGIWKLCHANQKTQVVSRMSLKQGLSLDSSTITVRLNHDIDLYAMFAKSQNSHWNIVCLSILILYNSLTSLSSTCLFRWDMAICPACTSPSSGGCLDSCFELQPVSSS